MFCQRISQLYKIRENEPTIVFIDKDAKRLHHPHDDAIVITLAIANYTTKRVSIDNGSSADILYYLASFSTNED